MGKERINHLLHKLEESQKRNIENSAAIFSVAQVAVNDLDKITGQNINVPHTDELAASQINKKELIRRYKTYSGCRKAAKDLGIKFRKTPSWEKLVSAFKYAEIFKSICTDYVRENPDPLLEKVGIEIRFN